jgi:hypothetical protein
MISGHGDEESSILNSHGNNANVIRDIHLGGSLNPIMNNNRNKENSNHPGMFSASAGGAMILREDNG